MTSTSFMSLDICAPLKGENIKTGELSAKTVAFISSLSRLDHNVSRCQVETAYHFNSDSLQTSTYSNLTRPYGQSISTTNESSWS